MSADPVAVDEPAPIDLRVVVDGPSTAGKTTAARSLAARLARPVVTTDEEETSGRTLLFDWLDHTGGRSDGRAIRTQVVAVPGHLPHLRARLLVTADVVVFVADSTQRGIGPSAKALGQLRALLEVLPAPTPGLLVQANKRDLPDALSIDEVRRTLALPDDVLVIETVATEGDGVRQSFVYAVRLALQHARACSGERVAERQRTAEALLTELDRDPRPTLALGDERGAEPAVGPASEAAPASRPEPEVTRDRYAEAAGEHGPEPAPAAERGSGPAPETETETESLPEPIVHDPGPAVGPQGEPGYLPPRVDSPAAHSDEEAAWLGLTDRGRPAQLSIPTSPPSVPDRRPSWRRWLDRR